MLTQVIVERPESVGRQNKDTALALSGLYLCLLFLRPDSPWQANIKLEPRYSYEHTPIDHIGPASNRRIAYLAL
jgi:hypothetical protein